jgi:hypothetical protein
MFDDVIGNIVAPQTVESMHAALEVATTESRRELIRRALAAGPGSCAWEEADAAIAGLVVSW